MLPRKIRFNMCFSRPIDGFPTEIDYRPGCVPEVDHSPGVPPMQPGETPKFDIDESGNVRKQSFVLEFYEKNGEVRGLFTSEHGIQKIDDIVLSDFSVSFSAYSGSKGVEIFHFVLLLSESTPQVVGFAGGIKPFFRGYMPLEGVAED